MTEQSDRDRIDDSGNTPSSAPPCESETTNAAGAAARKGTTGAPQPTPQSDLWWYAVAGKSYGPVTEEQLAALARGGHFQRTDYVYAGYIGNWVRADSVHGLFDGIGQEGQAGTLPAPVYVPPQSTPPASTAIEKEYAGFWIRFLALVIDSLALQGALCVAWMALARFIALADYVSFLLGPVGASADYGDIASMAGVFGLYSLLLLVVGWMYFALLESSGWQATLGKRAVGIFVTDVHGKRIGFWRASGRYFASLISYATALIGFLMGAFTQRKQTLHDLIAGTVVVYGKAGDHKPQV
jgi:uncharacterized RDD family membrane protein YckC